jgi:hypothetical protein
VIDSPTVEQLHRQRAPPGTSPTNTGRRTGRAQ